MFKSNSADGASLNAALNASVGEWAKSFGSGLGGGSKGLSAKELGLIQEIVGGTNTNPEALHVLFSMARRSRQHEINKYEHAVRSASDIAKQYPDSEPGSQYMQDMEFRKRMLDWETKNQLVTTADDVERLQRAARLTQLGKDAKDIDYEYEKAGNNYKSLIGKLVTDNGVLMRVTGFDEYKPGDEYINPADGKKVIFRKPARIPRLEAPR